ncbi:tetratricopeptide repeat protein 23-like isoform X2 [Odocoileus virginianus]|uniref:Tetratricopeptide repeat protein 23-like isoform X2 n=1 Tax=Odocoileus virginianus TaxID=9874 RepID=A0ABM4IXW4_ODOVR
MRASPIRIPAVTNDTDWDFCFHLPSSSGQETCRVCQERPADLEGNHNLRQGRKANSGDSGHALLHSGGGLPPANHGREAYLNLQKSERNMKELRKSYKGGTCGLQVSEKDLTIALGRASLANCRLNLALVYFEKAVDNVIANKGDNTSDLVSLYQEMARIEQLRRNHEYAIQYLHQAHSICVSLYTEVSPQAAEASALLAKAYAMSGEVQHKDAVGLYFMKSITAYQTTLGPDDYETLTTVEEFCKWLVQNGEKQEAYRLLKASLRSQVISYGDFSEKVAETFYNMGKICFAKGELRKAGQLLRKCLMIQILIYGDEHSKSRDTKNLLTLMQRSHSEGGTGKETQKESSEN